MGKNHNNNHNNKGGYRKKKIVTAVTFDENERHDYLRSMFGAKQRRKEHWQKKVEQEHRQQVKQERAELRQERKQKLNKTKQMIDSMKEKIKQEAVESGVKKEPEVKVKREGNIVIQTKFY